MPYRGTYVSIKLCIGGGADMGSQMDINSCTDACTHSNQHVWPQPISNGSFNWRWDLWLEVGPPIRGESANQRWVLQSQAGPPIGGLTSNWSFHLQSELPPLIGAPTSDWWMEQTFKVRWTCIHVLMHVHILTKVWEQRWGHWDTTTVPHRGTHVSI